MATEIKRTCCYLQRKDYTVTRALACALWLCHEGTRIVCARKGWSSRMNQYRNHTNLHKSENGKHA
eukprot:3581716-Pleurochrysis_carterae.AAC.1